MLVSKEEGEETPLDLPFQGREGAPDTPSCTSSGWLLSRTQAFMQGNARC